jgi:hypothetical protein
LFDNIQDPKRCLKWGSQTLFRLIAQQTNAESADLDVHHEFWNFFRYVLVDYLVAHRMIEGESDSPTTSDCSVYYNQLETLIQEIQSTKYLGNEAGVSIFLRANRNPLALYIKCREEQKKSSACQNRIEVLRESYVKATFGGSNQRVTDLKSSLAAVKSECEN